MTTVNVTKKESGTMEITKVSPREKALICFVTYVALGREDEGCALSGAKECGFTDAQLEDIRNYVRDSQREQPKEEEESLAALLAKTTKSSCCS